MLKSVDTLTLNDIQLTVLQICFLEDFLADLEKFLQQISNGIQPENRLDQLKKMVKTVNAEEYESFKATFAKEKEKYFEKNKLNTK